MPEEKSDKRGWPERLIDEAAHPTDPRWYEHPDGKDKPCKALQIIRESERLTLEAWPWWYSAPCTELAPKEFQTRLGRIFLCYPSQSLPLGITGLGERKDPRQEFAGTDDDVRERVRKERQQASEWFAGLDEDVVKRLCLGTSATMRKEQEPWKTEGEANQIRSCLDWLHTRRLYEVEPDKFVLSQDVAPQPLAHLAHFRPHLLCAEDGAVRMCTVFYGEPVYLTQWVDDLVGSERRCVETQMLKLAERAQVYQVYKHLMTLCDIHIEMKQGKILERAQRQLDASRETRKGTNTARQEPNAQSGTARDTYNPREDIRFLANFLHWMSGRLQYGSPEDVRAEFTGFCSTGKVDRIEHWLEYHKSPGYAEQTFRARIEKVRSAIKGLQPASKKVIPPPPDRRTFVDTLLKTVRYLNNLAEFAGNDTGSKRAEPASTPVAESTAGQAGNIDRVQRTTAGANDDFSFPPGQTFYRDTDLTLPTGATIEILTKLVSSLGRTVKHQDLHPQSTPSGASEELRTAIRTLRNAFKKHGVPFAIENKRGEGYVMKPTKAQ